jgi:spore maturation protein CgeB
MKRKTFLVDYFCCDKKNVLEEAKLINEDSYYVCEGFDSFTDKPYEEVLQQYDISFIGNIYGERQNLIDSINHDVAIFNNVYGFEHPKHVAATKINLNFCTSEGASDRIYKILGAKGFLLSNDWIGREEQFQDGKDLIIFKDIQELNDKISYYLKNEKERKEIATTGHQTVQKFNRLNWAKQIMEKFKIFKEEK